MGAINYRVHHRHTKSSASAVIDAQLPGIYHVQFAIIFHMKFKDSRLDEFLLASSGHNNKLRVIAQIKLFIDKKASAAGVVAFFSKKTTNKS